MCDLFVCQAPTTAPTTVPNTSTSTTNMTTAPVTKEETTCLSPLTSHYSATR